MSPDSPDSSQDARAVCGVRPAMATMVNVKPAKVAPDLELDATERARLLSVVEAGGGIPKLNELIRELTKINKPQATGGRASTRMSFNSQSTDQLM